MPKAKTKVAVSKTKTVSPGTRAALKAWETRRRRTKATSRSGAKTTRGTTKKTTVSAGTLAALKAWRTRRKNGWVHPASR